MAKKKYEEANIQAIADAIREKTGTDNTYDTSEMADGVAEVYEAGRNKEWSDFWDDYQNKGTRTKYFYGFAGWEVQYIRPKYKVIPKGKGMFSSDRAHQFMFYTNTTIKKVETDYFDFSKVGGLSQTDYTTGNRQIFYYCSNLEEMEDIGMPAAYYYRTWDNCINLQTIAVLRSEETTGYDMPFNQCNKLANITIEGVIGRSISFSSSPLTVESMKSIITHLKDYAGTDKEYTYTLTLSSASKTALEAEGATSPNNNLWIEYLDDIGWNLK